MGKYNKEKTFLEALKSESIVAFKEFYQLHYGKVASYVLKNNGSQDQVQDLFQEAVIVLLRYLRNPDFKLNENTQIGTFFFGIAKRMWLMKLRNSKGKNDVQANSISTEEAGIEEKLILEEKHELIAKHFKSLGEDCQNILTDFYFKKIQLIEVAKKYGYTPQFIRVKKNRCMNGLRNLVKSDKDYQKIANAEN